MSKARFDSTRYNPSTTPSFDDVLARYLQRRTLLRSGSAMAALSFLSGFGLTACDGIATKSTRGDSKLSLPATPALGFSSIPGSRTDAVVVADGYKASVLAPWGTPLNAKAADWKADGTNTALDQANALGMNHDGMHYFPLNGSSSDGLLCINHEFAEPDILHPAGPTFVDGKRTSAEEIRKEIYAHGVTVVRVRKTNGIWSVVEGDPHNRRITGATKIELGGPVAGHALVQTKFSTEGTLARGTFNNCGNGATPWGTYLTCEENWPGLFTNAGQLTAEQKRIGIATEGNQYGWHHLAGSVGEVDGEFGRFDITPSAKSALQDYRNEANGHGYIVEIDPYAPASAPVKRTALGRFRHEACELGKLEAGKPVVFYSGHDGRFEYIYKFVSTAKWDPADANRTDRLAVGARYMDAGTLYVARFNGDGTGEWLPLTPESKTEQGTLADTFGSLAEIMVNTVVAADLLKATPMDRPEWAAVDPITGSVYMTLTNNDKRTTRNAANPRVDNKFGHIIRWDESADHKSFTWDIFVFGAPADAAQNINRSGLTDLNQFASPDGLAFDDRGILWVQTDNGATELTSETNDQMLAVVPSSLIDANGEQAVIGTDNQMQLRRFLVGPNGCEITGLAYTPDHSTFFINVQHPSNWPYTNDATEETPAGKQVRPRAATVVIEKLDGGAVGT